MGKNLYALKKLVKMLAAMDKETKSRGYQKPASIIKASFHNTWGKQNKNRLNAHIAYIQREGAGEYGQTPANIGNSTQDEILNAAKKSGRNFRLIISPDPNLKVADVGWFAIRVMREFMKREGKEYQWMGTAHYNTQTPHAHIILDSGAQRPGLRITKGKLKEIKGIAQAVALEIYKERGPQIGPQKYHAAAIALKELVRTNKGIRQEKERAL